MCGFAGVYYFDLDREVPATQVHAMSERISHRGPNGAGVFVDKNVGLGHRRLSVIDLAGGAQPMTECQSGHTIAYNGEFFNYMAVREQLRAQGASFRTRSDTEVLLKLASQPFPGWLRRVNGMFAFALWDAVKEELLLVRDRFGVKPLYYVANDDGVAFASEVKALQVSGIGGALDVNPDAVPEYLGFRYVTAPRTLFRDVSQLPPGHYMRLRRGSHQVQVQQYWSEHDSDFASNVSSVNFASFGEIFTRAVGRRLVSDVPLGTFNSGGIDSSLVTREVRAQSVGELHTFSVGFSESDYDESTYAEEVAQRLGTLHHSEVLSPTEYLDLLPEAIWHNDEPLCHPHSVHLLHLCRVASKYVTVVLTGEGADEIFFGYPRLHIARIAARMRSFRHLMAKLLSVGNHVIGSRRLSKAADVLSATIASEIDCHRFTPLSSLSELIACRDYQGSRGAVLDGVSSRQSSIERLLEYERYSYMQSLLARLDKMSMASGLEARTPFLDFEMVLWSKRLRSSDKIGLGLGNKVLLKGLAVQTFSKQLVYRGKVGFGVPLRDWFREEPVFKDALVDIASPNSFVCSLVPRTAVLRLLDSHIKRRSDETEALWGLLNLELWARNVLGTNSAKWQVKFPAEFKSGGS